MDDLEAPLASIDHLEQSHFALNPQAYCIDRIPMTRLRSNEADEAPRAREWSRECLEAYSA